MEDFRCNNGTTPLFILERTQSIQPSSNTNKRNHRGKNVMDIVDRFTIREYPKGSNRTVEDDFRDIQLSHFLLYNRTNLELASPARYTKEKLYSVARQFNIDLMETMKEFESIMDHRPTSTSSGPFEFNKNQLYELISLYIDKHVKI